MSSKVHRLVVVPARGGSKRIPRKNIRPFLGIPLLKRTLDLIRQADVADRVIVSTDDDEIASLAIGEGAEVPFRRPSNLSGDHAATIPVISDAISRLMEKGDIPDMVCCIYPTAVLMRPDDLRAGLSLLTQSNAEYVFTATTFPYSIHRALRRHEDGSCSMYWPENESARSQDLPDAFHDAGQFYWGLRQAWLDTRPIFSSKSRMLVVPRYRVQDIDTPEDWRRAELLYETFQRES